MDTERIEHIEGQLMAVQAAIRGLILLNSSPQAAIAMVSQQVEEVLAALLPEADATESFLSGAIDARDRLLPPTGYPGIAA